MADYRKSENKTLRENFSIQVSQGQPTNLNFSDGYQNNITNYTNQSNYTNSFITNKRNRDESSSQLYRDSSINMAHHQKNGHRGSHRKKELVTKILDNLHKVSSGDDLKNSIKNFSVDEFVKFFQTLANMEYITSSDSDSFLGKNKEVITINEKMINYNPEYLEDDEKYRMLSEVDINKLIIRKDIPLRSILKDEFNILLSINNETVQSSPSTISFKTFFDEFFKNMKKENIIDLTQFKHLIKIYSEFVFNNEIILFTKEDKLLLDFIIDNSLSASQIEKFYLISKYWLFQDFIHFEKNIKFEYIGGDDSNQNPNMAKRRYESVLCEILNRIENHKDLFEMQSWINLILDIPRINDKVIENIIKIHEKIIISEIDKVKKGCAEKKSIMELLPHLDMMKLIYAKSRKYSEKLLYKFMDLTKSTDSHVIAQSILFLMKNIFILGKHEQEKIKEYAVNQFKDLTKITDATNYESIIISKYPLYLYLFNYDKELIFHLPEVYDECIEIVKSALNKDISRNLKKVLDTFHAEKLIRKCTKKSLPIILFIVESLNPEIFINKSLVDNNLFRRIKDFYDEFTQLEVIITLVNLLPLKEFFLPDRNFIWERIKFFDGRNMTENNLRIFSKMNANKNEIIFNELFYHFGLPDSLYNLFSDKIVLYIIYLILSVNESIINTGTTISKVNLLFKQNELNIILKNYKSLKSEKVCENLSELFKIITKSNISYLLYLKVTESLFDYFGKDEENNKSSDSICEMILINFREFLNLNITSSEIHISELLDFLKLLPNNSKEILFKNLDEKVKNLIRSKDFILFSDI